MEFAYWGEIGKWRGLMMIQWIYLSDVGFNMITDLKQDNKGQDDCIFDLKDGQELTLDNALKMIYNYDQNKKILSQVFKEFFKYDKREIKVRTNVDTLIKTGMYEMAKKEVDKKKQEITDEKEEQVAKESEVVFTSKPKKKKKNKLNKK